MLQIQLHAEEDITILSPYKAQISLYRTVLHQKRLFKINLKTIDSMQGQESECILLDLTVSSIRDGGLGFLSDFRRMNVGLTRARNHCIIVGSRGTLEQQQGEKFWVSKLSGAQRLREERMIKERKKHFRKILQYYQAKKTIRNTDPEMDPESPIEELIMAESFEEPAPISQSQLTTRSRPPEASPPYTSYDVPDSVHQYPEGEQRVRQIYETADTRSLVPTLDRSQKAPASGIDLGNQRGHRPLI